MTKDYKKLYEELKRDFDAAIEFTVKLEDDLAFLREDLGLRERIAQCVFSTAYGWSEEHAVAIYKWVTGSIEPKLTASNKKKGTKRGPYKKINGNAVGGKMRDAVKPKRKYTKKSKFWAKKKK